MKIQISFDTDNAAFEDSFLMEVTRVLQQAKNAILDGENCKLRDTNGNTIGEVTFGNNTALADRDAEIVALKKEIANLNISIDSLV